MHFLIYLLTFTIRLNEKQGRTLIFLQRLSTCPQQDKYNWGKLVKYTGNIFVYGQIRGFGSMLVFQWRDIYCCSWQCFAGFRMWTRCRKQCLGEARLSPLTRHPAWGMRSQGSDPTWPTGAWKPNIFNTQTWNNRSYQRCTLINCPHVSLRLKINYFNLFASSLIQYSQSSYTQFSSQPLFSHEWKLNCGLSLSDDAQYIDCCITLLTGLGTAGISRVTLKNFSRARHLSRSQDASQWRCTTLIL